ncbi:alpha/beta-hydrolase [Hortaea werneckii]|nr:alpha/beta-hydrolase [Hortaea werneckii]KAI7099703.1 alpha/beta-hydrolase [Hortaea werneckii]KAI7238752.1 alpha/beta-hydrolase [Hortaea werneckii]KAI7322512.1 alpha/beta-hydrolase [Hortaea werneckii]KAI7402093.1 alpha/beta-hydrolase [Hortaea werneckii]
MTEAIKPFQVNIPDEERQRLHRKLKDTRLPLREIVPDAGDRYGPSYAWAKNLYEAWISDFDWYEHQAQLNTAPHFIYTHGEGIKIHFLHAKSKREDAIPLLMVHGWPGSFFEFNRVWGPLSNPKDNSAPAFKVVVPSLPGYAFSDWPPRANWTLQDSAKVFDDLMKLLGYEKYMFQGGDWAHWVGRELGSKYIESCQLIHFNFAPSRLPDLSRRGRQEVTSREAEVRRRVDDWLESHMGYAIEMRTRPHTIGFAFNDNPMGILMWICEKYNEAAGPESQKQRYWTQHILATASLYYFTDCIMPSMLCYYDSVRHEDFADFAITPHNRITVPFGYTSFFWDTEPSSKRTVELTGSLLQRAGRRWPLCCSRRSRRHY